MEAIGTQTNVKVIKFYDFLFYGGVSGEGFEIQLNILQLPLSESQICSWWLVWEQDEYTFFQLTKFPEMCRAETWQLSYN